MNGCGGMCHFDFAQRHGFNTFSETQSCQIGLFKTSIDIYPFHKKFVSLKIQKRDNKLQKEMMTSAYSEEETNDRKSEHDEKRRMLL